MRRAQGTEREVGFRVALLWLGVSAVAEDKVQAAKLGIVWGLETI